MSLPTYIGFCCREWILAISMWDKTGRCGYCGERPTYLRPGDGNPDLPSPDASTVSEELGSESMGNLR